MPDTKITALTAITTVDPANDVLPIVDVSDTSMAASGTTKKITTNQLLGASGTATLASATITGDLTVDTSTLKVDSANNRVGVGTASPARPLDIVGSFQSSLGWVLTGTPAGLGAATRYIGGASTTDSWYYNAVTGGSHLWAFGESLAMTLNSTGLGVGTSPAYKLDVNGVARVSSGGDGVFLSSAPSPDLYVVGVNYYNNNGTEGVQVSARPSWKIEHKNSSDALAYLDIGFRAASAAASAFTSRFKIDGSGNVGIGVTPSAWRSGARAFQSGANGYLTLWEQANGSANLGFGVYEGSSNAFNYKTTGDATTLYSQLSGAHKWFTAPSGTAGNPITFTQAMTLDASGNLLVGTTGQNGSWNTKLTLSNDSGTTRWAVGPYLGGVTNFLISAGASAGVYLNGTAATSWTSASDERLKDIIEPISNAVAKVGSLRAVIGKFKFDELNTRKPFLIAQDVQSVLPEAVDASNPDKLGVAYTDVIPLLVAAIKELTARVQTLEAR